MPPPLRRLNAHTLDPLTADDPTWEALFAAIRVKLAEPVPERSPCIVDLPCPANPFFTGRARISAPDRSSEWPHDATRRNAGELVGRPVFGGERITIRAGRPAGDACLIVAGLPGGFGPGPGVGHRALDREESTVVVSDDQEKRCIRFRVRHEVNSCGV